MIFNKVEDKLTRFILMVLFVIMVFTVGFMAVRFATPIFKIIGVMGNVVTIWVFIKYLRKEFSKTKKEQ